jgi:hypothetical protein
MRGKRTSKVEVLNISPHGFWLLVQDRELFVPFAEFPWFKSAPVSQVLNVELPSPHHLYWPDLDVDLAVASIEGPEAFPLVSRALPNETRKPAPGARAVKPARGRPRAARG